MNKHEYAYETQLKASVRKDALPFGKLSILGILAGLFIALGAATSSTAAFGFTNVGLLRMITGMVFPVGLILIVFVGGELFTGNCLMAMGNYEKRISRFAVIKNLTLVWLTNLIGSLIAVLLVWKSANWELGNGLLGLHTIKVAATKCSLDPVECVTSGTLCNIFVCMAILAANAAKSATGKILAIWFPIFAFALGGFEHVVANMYYIPAGYFAAQTPQFVELAAKADVNYGAVTLTAMCTNFFWVTIGNIIGGILFTAIPVYYIRRKSN
jgi:formate/nitrite transporter